MADTKQEIKCPACGNIMKKISIVDKNFHVDICTDGCGGIFFDNREFSHFDEQSENADIIFDNLKDKQFIAVDTYEKRFCPACGSLMVKNYTSLKKEIEVDDCYNCGGKFIDYNKLVKIRNEYDSNAERKKELLNYVRSLYNE